MRIIFGRRKQRLFFLFLPVSWALAQSPQPESSIPVKHVILYKHGIGFFEREGAAGTSGETRLDFKTTDMNDVLKSLTVHDTSGNRINSVRYDSNETLAQRLAKFPFSLGTDQLLSSFLDSFKGARLELKSADRTVTGTIVGARVVQLRSDNSPGIVREQLTLLLDSGELTTIDLGAVASMRFTDARLQTQLKQYLETVNDVRSRDRRSIYIDAPGNGTRNLRIAYVTPTAIWKSSYRLALGNINSTLEGWAIVDNTTDEDWNNVQLSVVSGRPISFISQLDTPRYGRREVAELPEDRAAGPVVYGGNVDAASGVVGGATGGVLGGVLGGVPSVAPPPPPALKPFVANQLMAPKTIPKAINRIEEAAPRAQTDAYESSTVEGATGSTLGELFEYNFASPITIKRSQSAMLPFLQDRIAARKLLIYTESGGEHPVNAAEITNNTGKTLDGGPLTVYDGGAYAGEALVETLKASDKRLIGYAVDYGTRITTAFDSPRQTIREIHAKNGIFQFRYADRQTRTYAIKNVDTKPKTLVIQQEGIAEYTILSPKPTERTSTAYRFEVALPANGSQAFKVQQEHVYENTTEVLSSTPDFLLSLVSNKQLTDNGRKQLEALAALKRQLVQVQADLKTAAAEMSDLNEDSNRLRQNITSLNRVNGQEEQVRQYSSQLSGNEAQIVKLRDRQRSLTQRQTSLETEVRNAVDALAF